MGIKVKIKIPKIIRNLPQMISSGKASLLRGAGAEAQKLVKNHLRNLQSRHETASRLGAMPTNHLNPRKVSIEESTDSVSLDISIPGINRAYHDIRIRPVRAKALAIPMVAEAYGLNPRELTTRGHKMFYHPDKNEKGTLVEVKDGQLRVMYILRKSVYQHRDETLLPSVSKIGDAGVKGVRKVLDVILSK